MRIIFFGSGDFAIPTFRSLREQHELVGIVSQPDRPAGRGKHPQPTPLKQFAEGEGLTVIAPPNVNDPAVVADLAARKADFAYVASFGQKIGRALLDMFPVGIVNLHGSLLPAFRGAAPVQRAVLDMVEQTGVTIFRLVEEMDAGPILAQRRTVIGDDETAEDLRERLARIGCDCLNGALARLAADPRDPGDPQDASMATRAPKLSRADGWVDFSQPARRVARRINGLWSWPGATCRFVSADGRRDELVTLACATPCPDVTPGSWPPGAVTDRGAIRAGDGEVAILDIKPANGRLMDWHSFLNGRHVKPNDRFVGAEGGVRG